MRGPRATLTAAALACGFLMTGCSANVEPALGGLAPATDTQFLNPFAVALTRGSAGPEGGAGPNAFYWLTSTVGQVTVTNLYQTSPAVTLSMVLRSPPCPGGIAKLQVKGGKTVINQQVDSVAGAGFKVPLTVPKGRSTIVSVTVLSPPCHYQSDKRNLYLGVYQLSVS